MGDSGTWFGLGPVWFLGLHLGSQLQANGIVPLTAFLLLPHGEVHQTGLDWARVSLLGCINTAVWWLNVDPNYGMLKLSRLFVF